MKFSYFFASLLLSCPSSKATSTSYKKCLTEAQADAFVKAYQDMLAKVDGWQDIAKEYLRSDIVSTSDSDAFENQIPLNTTSYPGLQTWIEKIDGQMAANFDTLVTTFNCDTITWYQVFNQGGPQPVRAISIFFVDTAKNQVYKHFWEHNSGLTAWLQGFVCSNVIVSVGTNGPVPQKASCAGTKAV